MRAAASKHAITIALFGAVLSAANWSVAAQAAPPKGPCAVSKQIDVPAKMRDGVTLLADVYRPTEAGSYPVLLMRLPYNKTTAQTYVYASPEYYASQCYIVAIQDVRGQYASQGVFYAFKNEMEDGYDSVEWAAALPGSNGKVGMYGFSYVGATQWLAAVMRPPHLAAIAPAMTSSDYYDGWSYEGGAWSLAFEESWPIQTIALVSARRTGEQSAVAKINEATGMIAKTYDYLPLHDYPWLSPGLPAVAGYFYDWIAHDTWDDYWRQWSIRKDYGRVQVPALNFDGWYDVFLNGAVENYVGMRKDGGSDAARSAGRLVIGPYMHLPWNRKSADVDFGSEADNPIEDLQVAWFDHYLKGKDNGADKAPPVRVFVMGADRWRDADNWPIPGTQFTSYYLHSLGEANSSGGNGRISTDKPAADEPPDRYVYDPANPVPSRGGHSCCTPDVAPVGPANQADIEGRGDVLVYSTPTLDHAVEVTGPSVSRSTRPQAPWIPTGQRSSSMSFRTAMRSISTTALCARGFASRSSGQPTSRPARSTNTRSMSGRPATSSCRGTRSASRSPAATSHITTATRTPAIRSASTPPCGPHSRPSSTTPSTHRRSHCRSCRNQ